MPTYFTRVISKDEHEDRAVDRARLRGGSYGVDEIVALDIVYPGWSLSTFDHSWNWMAIAVADFYEREGRRPSQEAKNSEEKALGQWLSKQRKALRDGTLRVDRRAWLDEHYPTWNKTPDDVWGQSARAAADFYEREGRHPSAESKNSEEKKLGKWLVRQRGALRNGTLRVDRRAWLDEHYPTWNKSFDNLWDRTARSATAFYEREGRHPSATSKNSNEKALGQWLSRQRAALKDGTLRPDRRAWLDENYPTWANARP